MTKGQSYVDISLFRTRDQSHSFSTICTWAVEIGEKTLMMRHLSRAPWERKVTRDFVFISYNYNYYNFQHYER
jgi:hypothetical protein